MDDDAVGVRHDDLAVTEVAEDVAIEHQLEQPPDDRDAVAAAEQQQFCRARIGAGPAGRAHAMLLMRCGAAGLPVLPIMACTVSTFQRWFMKPGANACSWLLSRSHQRHSSSASLVSSSNR